MKMRPRSQCRACGVLAINLLVLYAAVVGRSGENLEAIRDFGISRGEPTEMAFFFYGGTYIDAPYVVERRGVDIYINDILVSKGPEWPPYDYAVAEDPGDPPPGTSPFKGRPPGTESRDFYWSKKWRYLYSHYDYETAKRKMFETYKLSTELVDVSWDEGRPDTVFVTRKNGKRVGIYLGLVFGGRAKEPMPTREAMLARREKKRTFHQGQLGFRNVIFKFDGGEVGVGGERGRKALHILLSDASDQEKLHQLREEQVLGKSDHTWDAIVTEFQAGPQLRERLDQWERELKKQERAERIAEAVAPIINAAEREGLFTMPDSLTDSQSLQPRENEGHEPATPETAAEPRQADPSTPEAGAEAAPTGPASQEGAGDASATGDATSGRAGGRIHLWLVAAAVLLAAVALLCYGITRTRRAGSRPGA